jgi:hypothetical protein
MPAIIYPYLPLAGEAPGAFSPLLQAGAERSSRAEPHPFDGMIDRVVAAAGANVAGSSMPSRPTE